MTIEGAQRSGVEIGCRIFVLYFLPIKANSTVNGNNMRMPPEKNVDKQAGLMYNCLVYEKKVFLF